MTMMTKPQISIVVAIAEKDRGIGHGSELLFRISDDLKRFKALTTGHPIIMGRKTFESIGRPLPGRENIVITRNPNWSAPGVKTTSSIEQAIEIASNAPGNDQIFIIGGGEIYKETLEKNLVDTLHLTVVHKIPEKEATVFFPEYSSVFTDTETTEQRYDSTNDTSYSWITLKRHGKL